MSYEQIAELSIIIPAFNEENRLPQTLKVLEEGIRSTPLLASIREVIVVDDGSMDGTRQFLNERAAQWPLLKILSLTKNQGKGAAVRQGLQTAVSEWVLVADADMATSWDQLAELVRSNQGHQFSLVMGSRGLLQSEILVRQHWFRQMLGKIFNWIFRILTGLPFKDTQCGFKLIHLTPEFRQQILPRLKVAGFAWDVELIIELIRHKKQVLEVPIRWTHQEESRVHIIFDSLEMLFTILRIRFKG